LIQIPVSIPDRSAVAKNSQLGGMSDVAMVPCALEHEIFLIVPPINKNDRV